MTNSEAVVIGGGLAGSAAAITLARSGARVTLLEREPGPANKVCGEFLSEEAVDVIGGLGVTIATFGAPRVNTLRLSRGRHVFTASLPFRAQALSRSLLDEALLRNVEALGGTVLRGRHVIGVSRHGRAWRVQLRGGEYITTPNVMLATGKHDVSGLQRPQGTQNDLIGFKQSFYLRPEQRRSLKAHIELHLFPGGYAGLQLVEDGSASLGCVVTRGDLAQGPSRWTALLERMQQGSPLLRERLEGALTAHEKPLAIAPIPYGLVQSETQSGLWLLGDQAAVVPSFTGDGMSMALHSGVLAAAALLAGRSSQAFQAEYARAVRSQVRNATWISQQMVRPAMQSVAAAFLHVFPGALSHIASRTRLSASTRRDALQAIESSLLQRPVLPVDMKQPARRRVSAGAVHAADQVKLRGVDVQTL